MFEAFMIIHRQNGKISISSPSKLNSSDIDLLLININKKKIGSNKNFLNIYFSLILIKPITQNNEIISKGNHIDKNSGIFSFSPSNPEK